MTKKEIDREFKKIDYELRVNKPDTAPYPPEVVKRRELLLYAQVYLAEMSWAKKCKDWETYRLHTEAYFLVMSKYYEKER